MNVKKICMIYGFYILKMINICSSVELTKYILEIVNGNWCVSTCIGGLQWIHYTLKITMTMVMDDYIAVTEKDKLVIVLQAPVSVYQ